MFQVWLPSKALISSDIAFFQSSTSIACLKLFGFMVDEIDAKKERWERENLS